MVKLGTVLWIALFQLSLVLANVESILVEVTHNANAGLALLPSLRPLEPFRTNFEFDRHSKFQEQVFPLQHLASGRYLLRLNWPACYPMDVSLAYDTHTQTVTVLGSQAGYVELTDLGKQPRVVPCEIILSPMKYQFIPEDVIPMIQSVSLAALVALVFSATFYKLLK